MGFRNKLMKEHENIGLCGYPVQILLILDNFCINRKLIFKKSYAMTNAMHKRGPKRRQKLTKARQSTV